MCMGSNTQYVSSHILSQPLARETMMQLLSPRSGAVKLFFTEVIEVSIRNNSLTLTGHTSV